MIYKLFLITFIILNFNQIVSANYSCNSLLKETGVKQTTKEESLLALEVISATFLSKLIYGNSDPSFSGTALHLLATKYDDSSSTEQIRSDEMYTPAKKQALEILLRTITPEQASLESPYIGELDPENTFSVYKVGNSIGGIHHSHYTNLNFSKPLRTSIVNDLRADGDFISDFIIENIDAVLINSIKARTRISKLRAWGEAGRAAGENTTFQWLLKYPNFAALMLGGFLTYQGEASTATVLYTSISGLAVSMGSFHYLHLKNYIKNLRKQDIKSDNYDIDIGRSVRSGFLDGSE